MTRDWAVWVYGSMARGDSDDLSDVDVLVVGPDGEEAGDLLKTVGLSEPKVSISQYSWNEIQGMAAYGSLFLHHIRLEGRPLYEGESCNGRLSAIVSQLGEYALARRDIHGFKVVLDDVTESLAEGGPRMFELSVLATVIRHASILGCWLKGKPEFGRLRPVTTFTATVGSARPADDFEFLYLYRLYCDGRLEKNGLRPVNATSWLDWGRRLVDALEGTLDAKC